MLVLNAAPKDLIYSMFFLWILCKTSPSNVLQYDCIDDNPVKHRVFSASFYFVGTRESFTAYREQVWRCLRGGL